MGDRYEVPCPACHEPILAAAKKCKHCGEWRSGVQAERPADADVTDINGATPPPQRTPWRTLAFAGVLFVTASLVVWAVVKGRLASPPALARNAVAKIVAQGARVSFGGPGLQGTLTDFGLLGMSQLGDCKKVHAYFRVGGGPELEGTFLYIDNGKRLLYRTYDAVAFDRKGAMPFSIYRGSMNSEEKAVCTQMLRSAEGFAAGPYVDNLLEQDAASAGERPDATSLGRTSQNVSAIDRGLPDSVWVHPPDEAPSFCLVLSSTGFAEFRGGFTWLNPVRWEYARGPRLLSLTFSKMSEDEVQNWTQQVERGAEASDRSATVVVVPAQRKVDFRVGGAGPEILMLGWALFPSTSWPSVGCPGKSQE